MWDYSHHISNFIDGLEEVKFQNITDRMEEKRIMGWGNAGAGNTGK